MLSLLFCLKTSYRLPASCVFHFSCHLTPKLAETPSPHSHLISRFKNMGLSHKWPWESAHHLLIHCISFREPNDSVNLWWLFTSMFKWKVVCIFRFYQIRGSLKVPPRVPHKVECSLLHPGGNYVSYIFLPVLNQLFVCFIFISEL